MQLIILIAFIFHSNPAFAVDHSKEGLGSSAEQASEEKKEEFGQNDMSRMAEIAGQFTSKTFGLVTTEEIEAEISDQLKKDPNKKFTEQSIREMVNAKLVTRALAIRAEALNGQGAGGGQGQGQQGQQQQQAGGQQGGGQQGGGESKSGDAGKEIAKNAEEQAKATKEMTDSLLKDRDANTKANTENMKEQLTPKEVDLAETLKMIREIIKPEKSGGDENFPSFELGPDNWFDKKKTPVDNIS